MSVLSTPVLSGLAVLVAGALAFGAVTQESPESAEQPQAAGTTVSSPTRANLDPAVESVLVGYGTAWVYEPELLEGIPETVTAVLDAYQAPLMVPVAEDGS